MSANIIRDVLQISKELSPTMVFDDDEEYDNQLDDEVEINAIEDALFESTACLARISESSLDDLKVSSLSKFSDMIWDFQDEGSPIYRGYAKFTWDQVINENVNMSSPECEPLVRLLKCIMYYCLPQNAIMSNIRSFTSTTNFCRQLTPTAKFLYEHGIYIDNNGNGSFFTGSFLTEDEILGFIEEIPLLNTKYYVARFFSLWQKLSSSGFLPAKYMLPISPISKELLYKLEKLRCKMKNPFIPISLDTLAIVVPKCVDLVDKYTDDIVFAYEEIYPILFARNKVSTGTDSWGKAIPALSKYKTDLWDFAEFSCENESYGKQAKKELLARIRNHHKWPDLRNLRGGTTVGKLENNELTAIAKELNIDLNEIENGSVYFDLFKARNYFMSLFTSLRDACSAIILLATGMRRSEFINLKVGKARKVPDTIDEYRLEFMVFKMEEGSIGYKVDFPIPLIAYKAFVALERITEPARRYSGKSELFVSITQNFGDLMNPGRLSTSLNRLWDDLGIEEHVHPHMFRKTLAMFAVYQDPRNIMIIKYLFSHKSLAMTFAYISKLPGMNEDVKAAILEMNVDLLAEIIESAKNNTIGGSCGLRIKEQLKKSKILARLNDDGRESLLQYVDSLLEHGIRILHRCPMNVICTNMHDSVVHIGPELCDCEVTNCDFAVFTEGSISDLQTSIQFHERLISHPDVSEDQGAYSRRIIKDCLDRLAEVKGKEAAMLQFPEHFGLAA